MYLSSASPYLYRFIATSFPLGSLANLTLAVKPIPNDFNTVNSSHIAFPINLSFLFVESICVSVSVKLKLRFIKIDFNFIIDIFFVIS